MSVDVLVIAAHPDDAELTVGGMIAKLTDRGKRVGIIDLTRGEMGTRGTPRQRADEAAAAAEVLDVTERINLDVGDGRVSDTPELRDRLIVEIRRLRPSIVLSHYWDDLHPDHAATGQAVGNIMYPVGFANHPVGGEPHRPNEFLFFMAHYPFEPSFIVDITGYWDVKEKAVRCYGSQLVADGGGPPTNIGRSDFMERLEARARYFGTLIQTTHGEPLLARRPVPMDDVIEHYRPFEKL